MSQDARDGLWGLIMWTGIGTIIILATTMKHWLAEVNTPEQPAFWVNVGVAIGTLALAAVTWWNVRVTRGMISAEDRRLQQSLAPLLLIRLLPNVDDEEPDFTYNGFEVTNHGKGLARDIQMSGDYFDLVYQRGERRPGEERPGQWVRRQPDYPTKISDTVDALAEQERRTVWLGLAWGEVGDTNTAEFRNIRLSYLDMFGNQYHTVYDTLHAYKWSPPSHLLIQQPRAEST